MLNKKGFKLLGVLSIILFSLVATACSTGEQYENKLEEIKANGKIVLGTSADYPPYEFHAIIDGKDTIVGFDIEIAKEIAKDLGVDLVIKDMKFDGLLAALDSGNVDFVLAGMTPTKEREENVVFSNIYYTAVQAIVVRTEDVKTVTSLDDLNGKTIGVQKGSIQHGLATEQFTSSKIKALGKLSDLMLELKNDKIDALIVELPVANSYVSKNQDLAVTKLTIGSADGGSAVAIQKGNQELVDSINETLVRLISENTIETFVAEANEISNK
ncbi:transporter substrate-binding domain-containing protein [Haloplasma contractile]|uniref:Amino acid abc transportersubstrate-binding protein n=1 Tax=Haloplasma contractile SSD-17B TaxID=1033810 RepID=F7PW27_9MOLU|nr:transporter substrate-binding domain-containing protein [Haloplasma contractile]ERJ12649.1 putative amino acid abc transportersubstrate-binding protein [Haloplasma contractile SSD-17B]